MYRVIQPIIENPFYELNLYNADNLSTERLRVLSTIVTSKFNPRDVSNTFKSQTCLRLINKDPALLGPLLDVLPFSYLIDLVIEYDFLHNYWNASLIKRVLNRSDERLKMKIMANTNYTDELVNLNNMCNLQYNFTDKVFAHRLHKYRFLDDYYLGTALVLYMSSRNIGMTTPEFVIYPRGPKIDLNLFSTQSGYQGVVEDSDYLIVTTSDEIFYVSKYSYPDLGHLLLTTSEGIIFDRGQIWCKPIFYQLLDFKPNVILSQLRQKPKEDRREIFIFPSKRVNQVALPKFKVATCYMCKQIYDPIYHAESYHSMCVECGLFNLDKRITKANLTGLTALVTGLRQKIGLCIALKLLRCGAKVIGTSRYPQATWYNYSRQPDFDEWKHRLIVCRCDFLNLMDVQQLMQFCKDRSISILINNACQTIQSSPVYKEKLYLLENLIKSTHLLENAKNPCTDIIPYDQLVVPWTGLSSEIVAKVVKDANIELNAFSDVQDINIKAESSWHMTIDKISPSEIMEATIINQLVPTLIINQLRPYMVKPTFIIQCTALEGTFNYDKNSNHAHTNMCKAAMNMMIRTMSEENDPTLHVYSINPGFVSGVNPNPATMIFPISPEDGASRILDPIIQYYNKTPLPSDWVILKNYHPTSW